MKLFLAFLLIGYCSGLRLPKIFKDGMVLQAGSVQTIWGFLDGVRSTVTLTGSCQLNGNSFEISNTFEPTKPVNKVYIKLGKDSKEFI